MGKVMLVPNLSCLFSARIDCMYSVWGSLELASKCLKPIVVTLLVWRITAWGVLTSDLGCAAR